MRRLYQTFESSWHKARLLDWELTANESYTPFEGWVKPRNAS